MPPFGFRKRERSASPLPESSSKRRKPAPKAATPTSKAKPSLFDTADEPNRTHKSLEESRKFLADLDGDDDSSGSSEADSDDFEDVPPAKRQKTAGVREDVQEDEESEDEEMDWEDAIQPGSSAAATPSASRDDHEIGDVSISMNEDGSYIEPMVFAATGKKGPSKRERHVRVQTHCLHVMSLMWHNTIRNSWANDKEVQKILVDGLPAGVKQELQRWKRHLNAPTVGKVQVPEASQPTKGKGKGKVKKNEKKVGRDWDKAAQSQEPDAVQSTNALLRLLKVLTAYWRKRFTITAPGLRKTGYKDLRRLRNEMKAWNKNKDDVEEHGERLIDIQAFRKRARECEGSRDVGAQLFVALLRGIGLEVRLVANIQPAGLGWSKAEEADPVKAKKKVEVVKDVESESDAEVKVVSTKKKIGAPTGVKASKASTKRAKPTRRSSRGNQTDPITLDDSDSPLSEAPSDIQQSEHEEDDDDEEDDLSVIDVTPSLPKKKQTHKKFDRDLAFPIYWAEVHDPTSHRFFPVDPVVLSTIASTDELLQTFEPRGKKAEVSKQVICYAIAYSADGTAKDVTVRYLKRHQLPGKTKGVRMPAEKVPIYNRKGKVKRYEDYDWFRTVMSVYDRPERKRTLADELEDQGDLKPFKAVKGAKVVEKESLQGYKQSADFVLELHLRREEALKPGAKVVKTFSAGKGDKAVDHDVYLREDIVVCKTVESWHKEGRAIRTGEQPLKYVPVRAVTLVRKREIEDAQRETGEKLKQGLYSVAQTDWIIPPPIENGVIPRNAFGNMDVYVPTMVPRGAIHLPLKGTAKLCRKLQIDYAEACTGFEFGAQRAVPILTGVVVARENEHLVRDAWRAEQKEQKRKEDTKRTATALHWWRKMLLSLRVLERMRVEYKDAGGKGEEINPFVAKAKREGRELVAKMHPLDGPVDDAENAGGGFLPDDYEDEAPTSKRDPRMDEDHIGGFLVEETADGLDNAGGGFMVDDDESEETVPQMHIAPKSLQSLHRTGADDELSANDQVEEAIVKKPTPKANKASNARLPKPKAAIKRSRKIVSSDDNDDHDDDDESSLSDLDSSSADELNDSATVPDSTTETTTPSVSAGQSKVRSSSPQVVVTPLPSSVGGRGRRGAMKKATPVRSPYFDHGNVDVDGHVQDEEEEEDDEEEVVKPRRTTARTKGRS